MEELGLQAGYNGTVDDGGINLAYLAAEVCLSIAATASNLIVIIAFCTNGKLRTIPNWYIASLSVSDLLMGVFGIPFILIALTGKPKNNFGLCISAVTVIVWVELCSCFTLFALSCDRYYAVCKPLEYTTQMTHRRVLLRITFAWVTPLLYSLLVPIVWIKDRGGDDTCLFVEVFDLRCMMVAYLGFFLPLYGIMCFMYYKIFQAIRKQLKRLSQIQEVGIRLRLSSHGSATKLTRISPNATAQSTPVGRFMRDSSKLHCRHICKPHINIADGETPPAPGTTESDVKSVLMISNKGNENDSQQQTEYDLKQGSQNRTKLFFKRDIVQLQRSNSFPILRDTTVHKHRLSTCFCKGRETMYSKVKEALENNNQLSKPIQLHEYSKERTEYSKERPEYSKERPEYSKERPEYSKHGHKRSKDEEDCPYPRKPTDQELKENETVKSGDAMNEIREISTNTTPKSVNQVQSNRYRQERKTATLFVFILLFFFVSWSPVYIVDIFLAYDVKVNQALVNFAVLLSHFNSAFNPILYAYKKEFRRTLFGWVRSCHRFLQSNCKNRRNQSNQVYPYAVNS